MKYGLEAEDFADNYREVYKNTQKMYHTAFIIVIWGKNRDALREAESHVTVILESNRIYYEIPDYRHLDTFLAAQPYPEWVNYSWCELFSYHTAALFPSRNPNSRTDENGSDFGDDMKTGKSIQINLKALAAQHLMFVGPTGSGKTFTLLLLLMRSFDMLGKRSSTPHQKQTWEPTTETWPNITAKLHPSSISGREGTTSTRFKSCTMKPS